MTQPPEGAGTRRREPHEPQHQDPPVPPSEVGYPLVRVGTRASALALAQSGMVARDLGAVTGLGDAVGLVRVRTDGDRLTGSLATIGGTGVFVAALREALLDGRVHLAVHSAKDLPTTPADGLALLAVPQREDPRDALCARDGLTLAGLPQGARVGTGSPRRAAQLLAARPDLEIVDIRGNVDTRLGRVAGHERPGTTDPGDLDAVVLAVAGLSRLGRLEAVTEVLTTDVMLPAPGQGALAVEGPDDLAVVIDAALDDLGSTDSTGLDPETAVLAAGLAQLDHEDTRLAITAERSLLAALEAGCAAPVGALARRSAEGPDRLTLEAVVCRPDGSEELRTAAAVLLPEGRERRLAAARELGERVARHLVESGAPELAPLRPALLGWRVLVPRGGEWGDRVARMLTDHGAQAVTVPLIEFEPPTDLTPMDSALAALARGDYDWLAVTSGTTVMSLAARVATLANRGRQTPAEALATFIGDTRVAAVGPGTARTLERWGVTAHLVPQGERSAAGLLAEFPDPAPPGDDAGLGRRGRVLVPHSDLAEPTLADGLRERGWEVHDVVAYRTVSGELAGAGLRDAMREGGFHAVLLSSASTVTHLVELVGTPPAGTVVACIGPRTRAAAEDLGLPVHVVPDQASAEELVLALVEYAREHRS